MHEDLHELVSQDDTEGLDLRLRELAFRSDTQMDSGETLLTWAAAAGSVRVAELLLKKWHASPDLYMLWPTPLALAAEKGHLRIVEMLLAAGADLGSVPYSQEAEIPLLAALYGSHWEIVERLLSSGATEIADESWLNDILDAALVVESPVEVRILAEFLRRLVVRFEGKTMPVEDRLLEQAVQLLEKDPETGEVARDLRFHLPSSSNWSPVN
jgi:hypothetical protein